jgi:hypothetical protein
VLLQTQSMREHSQPATRLSRSNYRHAYWTLAQMVTQHSVNGCNLRPGICWVPVRNRVRNRSKPEPVGTVAGGQTGLTLANGEQRRFLEDGDDVTLRAWCERAGRAPHRLRIGERPRTAGALMYPQRIVCLTEEPTEVLYAIGEQDRIVGVSGFTVRPARVRKEKPRVSAFTSASIDKILALKPDLAIGFSDIQADIARDLIRHGVEVWISNHRTVAGIFSYIRRLGALVGAVEKTEAYARELEVRLAAIAEAGRQLTQHPRVYFEEWDQPMISGIALGIATGGHRRWRGCLSGTGRLFAGQGPHTGRPTGSGAPKSGHHAGFLVWQTLSPRARARASRMAADAGGARQ